ncbi:MAG: hypothetical protein WC709_08725 [Thermoleophilia bacterium]
MRTWLEKTGTIEYPEARAVDGEVNAVVAGSGNPGVVTWVHGFVVKWDRRGARRWVRLSYNSLTKMASWSDVVCSSAGAIWVGGSSKTSGGDWTFRVRRYGAAGATVWTSDWMGFKGLGGGCQALCLGKTGLFAGGSYQTAAAGVNAAAVKYIR